MNTVLPARARPVTPRRIAGVLMPTVRSTSVDKRQARLVGDGGQLQAPRLRWVTPDQHVCAWPAARKPTISPRRRRRRRPGRGRAASGRRPGSRNAGSIRDQPPWAKSITASAPVGYLAARSAARPGSPAPTRSMRGRLDRRVVADHHERIRIVARTCDHGLVVAWPGIVEPRIDGDAPLASEIGKESGERLAGAACGRAEDAVGGKPLGVDRLRHRGGVPPAARRQRPVDIGEAGVPPGRFRMAKEQEPRHSAPESDQPFEGFSSRNRGRVTHHPRAIRKRGRSPSYENAPARRSWVRSLGQELAAAYGSAQR